MLYHPEGMYVWDTWYFPHEGKMRCIHLQLLRPGSTKPEALQGTLGQAVSNDLVHWQPLEPALLKGPPGAIDDMELWTGCVLEKDNMFYLYYTARSSVENGHVNRVALATSTDGVNWTRYSDNPLFLPDERFYANEFHPVKCYGHGHPIVDGRDMCVVTDPEGNGYWGFFAARRHADTCAQTSVISLCHSYDLIHWEQHPPCFTPDYLGCVEVPDVFFLAGKWYMLTLTGNRYGHRGCVSDPLLREATIYAVSDHVQGPYMLDETDNVLFGSIHPQGYCGKTVEWQGERILFYTQGEMKDGSPHGSISFPHKLAVNRGEHLRAMWYPPLSAQYHQVESGGTLDVSTGCWGSIGAWNDHGGVCDTDWAVLPFHTTIGDGMVCVDVKLIGAKSAGVTVRLGNNISTGGILALLDAKAGLAEITRLRDFPLIECRTFLVEQNTSYHLRLVMEGNVFLLYVNDCLLIQCYEPFRPSGHVALFVEHGRAIFENLHLYQRKKEQAL